MNIAILDDYQDAVRKLPSFHSLAGHDVKIYNNNIKGVGQLSVRLRDVQALVLIRERTQITRALLDKTPKLKLISQTGRAGSHIDLAACTERGVAVCEGSGDPRATADLCTGCARRIKCCLHLRVSPLINQRADQRG